MDHEPAEGAEEEVEIRDGKVLRRIFEGMNVSEVTDNGAICEA